MCSIKKHGKNKPQNKMIKMVTSTSVVTININGSNYLVKLSQIGPHTTQIKLLISYLQRQCRADFKVRQTLLKTPASLSASYVYALGLTSFNHIVRYLPPKDFVWIIKNVYYVLCLGPT